MEKRIKDLSSELDFHYGSTKALKQINLDILENRVTALIGPSGCGKTTFLRCLTTNERLVKEYG